MKVTVMATIEAIWIMEDRTPSIATNEDKLKIAEAIKEDIGADHVVVTMMKVFYQLATTIFTFNVF